MATCCKASPCRTSCWCWRGRWLEVRICFDEFELRHAFALIDFDLQDTLLVLEMEAPTETRLYSDEFTTRHSERFWLARHPAVAGKSYDAGAVLPSKFSCAARRQDKQRVFEKQVLECEKHTLMPLCASADQQCTCFYNYFMLPSICIWLSAQGPALQPPFTADNNEDIAAA
eukprot:1161223-Pelagomonas_calceolata.AAC.5